MTDKPILFNTDMVEAILADRKTQTRRVVKANFEIKPAARITGIDNGKRDIWFVNGRFLGSCPYGRPGDLLWVRETWQGQNQYGQWWHEVKRHERPLHNWAWTNPIEPAYDSTPPKWLPSIHMPRHASRITLRVTGVRVERVQDISEADAEAEGLERNWIGDDCPPEYNQEWRNYLGDEDAAPCYSARDSFRTIWDSINAKRGYSWQSNPWVWVVEFERMTP